jgi:hypothetical protein
MHNYDVFEATLVLDSYKNKFIDLFDAHTLFHSLLSDAASFNLQRCGSAGLCFKQEINIRGCRCKCKDGQ